jgi:peptidoglycan hydrolase-like protein with peptidoglycan-binding domain
VLHMDSNGVGHKTPDQSQAPSVLHMDDKGVGHDKADEVAPEVASALKQLKPTRDNFMGWIKTVRDAGAKWDTFAADAGAHQNAAQAALVAATAAWSKQDAGSGLEAANQAAAAKAASDAAAKSKSDAQALIGSYSPAQGEIAKRSAFVTKVSTTFAKDKPRWSEGASPMTAAAVDELSGYVDDITKAFADNKVVENNRAARFLTIDNAAMLTSVAAAKTAAPLAKGPTAYVITALMQQKLNVANVAGGGQRVSVTAVFDADTETALKAFQKAQGLPETGIADVATWTALNAAAPTETKNGQLRSENEDLATTGSRPDGGIHPTLKFPTKGAAVRELQERLNNWRGTLVGKKPFSELSVDGLFGLKTRSAVQDFQKAHGLKDTAVVDDATWTELDKNGGVTGGTREFKMTQIVEGMLTGVQARYNWEVTKDQRLVITVKINFTGEKKHPMVATWLQDIKDVWNGYKAVEVGGTRSYDIEFKPVVSSSGHHKVEVCKPTKENPNPRSDAAHWYVNDTRKGLAPHEFGHLVGLDDEYNRPEGQYVESTGEEPKIGTIKAGGGKSARQVADLIYNAIQNSGAAGPAVSAAVARVVKDEGITQGSFARQVIKVYEQQHPYEQAFKDALAGSSWPVTFTTYLAYRGGFKWTTDLTRATTPFSESNTSIMGTMQSVPDNSDAQQIAAIPPHDHPVQPRHLRSFAALLVQAMPGTKWKTEKR